MPVQACKNPQHFSASLSLDLTFAVIRTPLSCADQDMGSRAERARELCWYLFLLMHLSAASSTTRHSSTFTYLPRVLAPFLLAAANTLTQVKPWNEQRTKAGGVGGGEKTRKARSTLPSPCKGIFSHIVRPSGPPYTGRSQSPCPTGLRRSWSTSQVHRPRQSQTG